MDAVLASRNPGKLAELRVLLAGSPLALVPPNAPLPDVAETGATCRDNARLKARAAAAATARWALADDSGLEVDALGGAPGVRSARFAGPGATDAANVAALLAALPSGADRSARFRCVLVLVAPDGAEAAGEGTLEGSIAPAPRGTNGFGYDPVFIPAGETRTLAEMTAAEKDALSHRARAAADLLRRLPIPGR